MPDEHLTLLQNAEFDFLSEVLDKAAASTVTAPVSIFSLFFFFYFYVLTKRYSLVLHV